ncbi:MAG: Hsp70 family protein [Rhodobacteraceae bacterium]|nr:Hsp70 family protein [Paracoccaceae bacterium]
MGSPVLAVDFGTSNSAAAVLMEGVARRLPIENGADTVPTAVFFPQDRGPMLIGTAAARAMTEGVEGRYMRALKSILGTTLFHEDRMIGGQRRTLAQIVTAFLAHVKQRAEAETGQHFTRVLSGRPVHFHSADPERDARAEDDLRACYHAAGFDDVRFLFEPEAAARAQTGQGAPGQTDLIVDIGGGTSDFSVFRETGSGLEILASHGIRLGGTDFDKAVSVAHAMPLLGLGGQLRRTLGDGLLPVPSALYHDLATWAKIPFLYTRDTERSVEDLVKHAVDPDKMGRLRDVITEHLGHELAFAVEAGKIAANTATPRARIDMGVIEPGLSAPITPGTLNAALAGYGEPLREALFQTLIDAQVPPDRIGAVVLVGGSSLMAMVRNQAQAVCPSASLRQAQALTAIIDGLAIATSDLP